MFIQHLLLWSLLVSLVSEAFSQDQIEERYIVAEFPAFKHQNTRPKREICISDALYCGHEKPSMEPLNDEVTVSHYLYSCSALGYFLRLEKRCRHGCTAGYPSHCNASCSAGQNYCGHELANLDFDGALNNTIYKCNADGKGFSYVHECSRRCKESLGGPQCIEKEDCTPGRHYCHEMLLQLEGWSHNLLQPNTIWKCTNGTNAVRTETCEAGCIDDGSSVKCRTGTSGKCQPSSLYCGSELKKLTGWSDLVANNLYRCTTNGSGTELVTVCKGSCMEAGKKDSYCQATSCDDGYTYCGHELIKLNWTNMEATSLYRCDGPNVVKLKTRGIVCQNTTPTISLNNRCVQEKFYCGSELLQLGFDRAVDSFENDLSILSNVLYVCKNNVPKYLAQCPDKCVPNTEDTIAHCPRCNPGNLYCGYEKPSMKLLDDPPNDVLVKDYLYKCSPSGNFLMLQQKCSNGCTLEYPSSYCNRTLELQSCTKGLLYCGYEKPSMKLLDDPPNDVLVKDYLYKCSPSGNFLMLKQKCSNGCTLKYPSSYCNRTLELQSCTKGLLYCGHQKPSMQTIHGSIIIDKPEDNYIYQCSTLSGEYLWLKQKCHDRCVPSTEGTKTHCLGECTPGNFYCGSELRKYGWKDVDSNDLFYCRNETKAEKQRRCQSNCSSTSGLSKCLKECNPGFLYCGHELQQLGFPNIILNNLYRCSNGTEVAYHQTCPDGCEVVGDNENSRCLASSSSSSIIRQCGTKYEEFIPFIRGGEESKRGKWPWMVSIRQKFEKFVCGGTLIEPQWVLTAAHCVDDAQSETVILGELGLLNDYERGQVKVKIDKVIIHPDYRNTSMNFDIALLRLSHPVKYSRYIQSACLPKSNGLLPAKTECVVVGWGMTLSQSSHSDILQEGITTILSNGSCQQIYTRSNAAYDSNSMICAGPTNRSQVNTCVGDSGGPLLCNDGGGWTVHGITSYGKEGSCLYNYMKITPEVFTRVKSYLHWIKEEMRKSDGLLANLDSLDPYLARTEETPEPEDELSMNGFW